jgi:DNA primase
MPRIPEETLQQILASTDIVDLVGRSVKLRRVGTNWRGLCPFHQEKTPSFYVNPQRSTYHCFGCGAGGNAFRFIMEQQGLTFVEAVRRLADAAGIRIEEEEWNEELEKAARIRKGLLKVHADIAEWYHQLLMKDAMGAPARDYLKSRGISAQTAKSWKMGYAPAGGEPLRQWAASNKYAENFLVHAGLLARGDEDSSRPGETYPRFRHRLMFPIRNDNGEVIAFSGRLLDPEAKAAKYLNSPETPIFSKSKVLFGLDMSKRAIIKASRAIVCEGQIDMITVFESGFENVVAPLGTAFTEYHARMLRRHADEVVLCYDSDTAGYKAAERAFVILAPTGLVIKVAPLPQGEDPDSLIRNQGPDAFKARIDDAKDFFDHVLDHATRSRNLSEPREKSKLAAELVEMIRLVDNSIARDAAIQKVSMRVGIPESEYKRDVDKAIKAQGRMVNVPGKAGITGSASGTPSVELGPQDKHAQLLCRLALSDPGILNWLRGTGRQAMLGDISGTDLLALIWNSNSDLTDPVKFAAFLSTLNREEETALNHLMAQRAPQGGMKDAQHALEGLELKRLDNLVQRTETQLKQPGLDPALIPALMAKVAAAKKEYLDHRARFKDIPPLPET